MPQRRIHLVAPAAPCRPFLKALELASAEALIEFVQALVGRSYRVTGDPALLDAEEDDRGGGRTDDARRAKDLEVALADSDVAAMIALRGGAWFCRTLPHIDFGVLDRRTSRVAVFGFSEITPLINVVAAHPNAIGVYYMGPAFLSYGLRHYAARQREPATIGGLTPEQWMRSRLQDEVRAYFEQVVALIEGRSGETRLNARLVRGELPERASAAFTGGNLTVLSTMLGSRFERSMDPRGRWLFLEDFNDKPERFDRFLAHLTLAGVWERCEGLLLGNFHNADGDLIEAVVGLLRCHLPPALPLPVLVTNQVGHIWPMTPFPLHQACTIGRTAGNEYELVFPSAACQCIYQR